LPSNLTVDEDSIFDIFVSDKCREGCLNSDVAVGLGCLDFSYL
jgi:hypothetical protein